MLYFDGVLGDRTDPLMQAWVAVDQQIKARIFADNTLQVSETVRVLRDKYMPLRLAMSEYVLSLNDPVLFQKHVTTA